MSLLARVKAAFSSAKVIGATVRPYDEYAYRGREQQTYQQLVGRYCGWVYVAASRNSTDVASVPLRLFTRQASAATKVWGGRRVSRKQWTALGRSAGQVARVKGFGQYESGDVAEITDPTHPVLALLSKVNPWQNGFEFLETLVLYQELTGNAFVHCVESRALGYPEELWLLPTQHIYIVPSREDFISGYIYGRGTEIEQRFGTDEIVHFKYPNPSNPYYGAGPLAAAVVEADTSRAITTHSYAMLENGAQPGIIVHGKNLQDKERQSIEAELNRRHSGVRKAGRSMVLSGEVDIVQWAMGQKELAYLESAKDVRDTIAAIFGVSVSDLTAEDVNRANAEAGNARQERRAVRPRCRRIEDVLNQSLLPKFFEALGDDSLFVCFDSPEKEDDQAIVNRVVQLRTPLVPIITLNEARQALMLPPMDGGDDVQYGQPDRGLEAPEEASGAMEQDQGEGQSQPTASGQEGVVTDLTGIDAERAAALCGEVSRGEQSPEVVRQILLAMGISADGVDRMIAAAIAFTPKEPEPAPVVSTPNVPPEPPPQEKHWYWDHDHGHDGGERTKSAAETRGEDLIEQAVNDWYAAVIEVTREGDINAVSLASIRANFADRLRKILNSLLIEGASAVGASFEVAPQQAIQYLDNYTLSLTGEIAASTEEAIKRTVQAGLAEGKSTDEIRRDVAASLREESPFRAERIARTETANALNQGRITGWQELGYTGKEWVLSVNPCPICVAMAAKFNEPIRLDQSFLPKGSALQYVDESGEAKTFVANWKDIGAPPIHPQCRCDIRGIR